MTTNVVFTGTIAQAVKAGLTVNGVTLKQPELSMLTRIGRGAFAVKVGTVPRPAGVKGKPSTIWAFSAEAALTFAASGVQPVTATVATSVPVVILSDTVEAVEDISDDAELADLMADEADDSGDISELEGVVLGEDGSYRLSGPLRSSF